MSAATTIEIGAPQIPIGDANVGGGAATDDGSTNQPFVRFRRRHVAVLRRAEVLGGRQLQRKPDVRRGRRHRDGDGVGHAHRAGPDRRGLGRPLPAGSRSGAGPRRPRTTYTASWTSMRGVSGRACTETTSPSSSTSRTPELHGTPGRGLHDLLRVDHDGRRPDGNLSRRTAGSDPEHGLEQRQLDVARQPRSELAASSRRASAKFEKFATADNGSLRDTFDLMSIGGV